MNNRTINQEVHITALYFQNGPDMSTLPRRMEWMGQTYTFREGLQKLIGKGKSVIRIFDMSDGEKHYRLMSDDEQAKWTLVNITAA
ncbi:MAG TPA: hypothetical protein VLF60_05265 [Candidatus Saccharimonadales bacterium]|nr:hypothetical protein [Candidatus Saccharimonadales bacterium]